jgi:hypothetical protein
METELRPGAPTQFPRARHVVCVHVRVDHICETEPPFLEQILILLHTSGGVNDDCVVTDSRGDYIRRAAALFIKKLLEIHGNSQACDLRVSKEIRQGTRSVSRRAGVSRFFYGGRVVKAAPYLLVRAAGKAPGGKQEAKLAHIQMNVVLQRQLADDVVRIHATLHAFVCGGFDLVAHSRVYRVRRDTPGRECVFLRLLRLFLCLVVHDLAMSERDSPAL